MGHEELEHLKGSEETPQGNLDADRRKQDADRRQRKITDYQEWSLAKDDPLEANLGVINGDLMFMHHLLQDTVVNALKAVDSTETLAEATATVGMDLKIVKQVERFSHLVAKLGKNSVPQRPVDPSSHAESEEVGM